MHKSFIGLLKQEDVQVLNMLEEADEIMEGTITIGNKQFPIVNGVPVFYDEENEENSQEQKLTNKTFSFKWGDKVKKLDDNAFEEEMRFVIKRLKPLGINTQKDYNNFLKSKKMILDAGSGMGWMSRYMAQNTEGKVVSAEIGDGVFAGYEQCKSLKNCYVIKADLMNLPFQDDTFDFIYSDGVLHHTPDCKAAIKALYDKLERGGVFWFYIYKEMNPVKHFCDDYIINAYSKMDPEEALEECKAITELGRELSKVAATIKLEKPIKILNIPVGTYDVQRFIYYNFLKCFWNDKMGYEYSNVTNYDWYAPNNASQQTEEQVKGWLEEFGINKYDFYTANPNGLNVVIYK